jgi:hypothetical protein
MTIPGDVPVPLLGAQVPAAETAKPQPLMRLRPSAHLCRRSSVCCRRGVGAMAVVGALEWPVGQEFQDVICFTKPPHAVQAVMFGLLSPIGRMRGYRRIYPEYSHPQGHTTPYVLALAGLTPPE